MDLTSSPNSGHLSSTMQPQSGSGSLKGKLLSLEETIQALTQQLNFHKNEALELQAEKSALETALQDKLTQSRQTVVSEMGRVDEEMRRQFGQQKTEHARLQS